MQNTSLYMRQCLNEILAEGEGMVLLWIVSDRIDRQ